MSDRVLVVIGHHLAKMVVAELGGAIKRGQVHRSCGSTSCRRRGLQATRAQEAVPWVATLRRPADGGRYNGTETERMMIIRQAIASSAFSGLISKPTPTPSRGTSTRLTHSFSARAQHRNSTS